MPDFPSIQFVSAPSEAADLRYDFNDRDATGRRAHPLGADGLDLGVPSFSGEPEGVGGDYGERRMHLTQRIEGSRNLALAKMSLLARQLLRPTNWLRVQWAAGSTPFYFKTFRGEPGALDLEHSETASAWDVAVPLTAEGFAYGPRETIPQVQIVQSPADLTGPTRYAMRYVLPAIKGDAPAPLRVTVTPGASATAFAGASWMVGCVSGAVSNVTDPVFDIGTGDGLTAGAGTGAGTADANYFNGSYRTVTVSAGAGNLLERLSGSLALIAAGRYKVMLRVEADGVSGVSKPFVLSCAAGSQVPGSPLTYGPATVLTVNPTAAASVRLWRGWVDLGDFQFPFGINPDPNLTSPPVPIPVANATFSIKIGTTDSSAGTVRMDAIKLIGIRGPLVDRATLLKSTFTSGQIPLSTARAGVWDGDTESFLSVSANNYRESIGYNQGGYPVADPASPQNLLILMATSHGDATAASTTASVTVKDSQVALDVSYHPRWLFLGDGT